MPCSKFDSKHYFHIWHLPLGKTRFQEGWSFPDEHVVTVHCLIIEEGRTVTAGHNNNEIFVNRECLII